MMALLFLTVAVVFVLFAFEDLTDDPSDLTNERNDDEIR